MNILVINCGSSSLKFQLIDAGTEKLIAKGLCERIGIDGSQITYAPAGGEKQVTVTPMKDHTDAIRLVLNSLMDEKTGVVKKLDEIGAVGHRIVHGGENFASSTAIAAFASSRPRFISILNISVGRIPAFAIVIAPR